MNIEKIEINGYYVWVDKDAEIKEGDWFINLHPASNYIDKKAPVFTKRFAMNSNAVFINPKKIIAASPELNLEGVLTYVEWLFENQKIELNGGNLIQVIKDVFIKGYQAAEKELPTWDDVRKSIELAQTVKDYGDYKPYTEEQIIKQLKQSKK